MDVFDDISGYRRYKITVFRRSPARGGYRGTDSTLLSAVAMRTLYFTHLKLFNFPNIVLVQRIVRFVMRTVPKASYRTFNTNTRIVTPLLFIYYFKLIFPLMTWCNFFQTNLWMQNMHKHKRRDLSYQPITDDHMQSYYDGGIAFSHMTFPHSFSITPHQWTQGGERESLIWVKWTHFI